MILDSDIPTAEVWVRLTFRRWPVILLRLMPWATATVPLHGSGRDPRFHAVQRRSDRRNGVVTNDLCPIDACICGACRRVYGRFCATLS